MPSRWWGSAKPPFAEPSTTGSTSLSDAPLQTAFMASGTDFYRGLPGDSFRASRDRAARRTDRPAPRRSRSGSPPTPAAPHSVASCGPAVRPVSGWVVTGTSQSAPCAHQRQYPRPPPAWWRLTRQSRTLAATPLGAGGSPHGQLGSAHLQPVAGSDVPSDEPKEHAHRRDPRQVR